MNQPLTDEALRAEFSEWAKRTNVRFAPYMGSVEDAFRAWLADRALAGSADGDQAKGDGA